MSNAKLLVPAGVLTHDSCGETFSPTQFALFGAFALLFAALTGSIPPSLNVVEEISNTPCADAAHQDATTIPLASMSLPITRFMSFLQSGTLPWAGSVAAASARSRHRRAVQLLPPAP